MYLMTKVSNLCYCMNVLIEYFNAHIDLYNNECIYVHLASYILIYESTLFNLACSLCLYEKEPTNISLHEHSH